MQFERCRGAEIQIETASKALCGHLEPFTIISVGCALHRQKESPISYQILLFSKKSSKFPLVCDIYLSGV